MFFIFLTQHMSMLGRFWGNGMFKLLKDGFVLKKLLEWRWCGHLWMQCWMCLKGRLSGYAAGKILDMDPGIPLVCFRYETLVSPWCGQEHPNPTGMEHGWGWEEEPCAQIT